MCSIRLQRYEKNHALQSFLCLFYKNLSDTLYKKFTPCQQMSYGCACPSAYGIISHAQEKKYITFLFA